MLAHNSKKNPYDWINPIVEAKLFAGRRKELDTIEEEIKRLADAKPIIPMIAVVGERRVGKTSLMRRIEEMCHKYRLLAIVTSITNTIAGDSWYFWQEIFSKSVSYTHLTLPTNREV